MLKDLVTKRFFQTIILSLYVVPLVGCSSISMPTLEQMVVNLSRYYPQIWKLITAAAYIMGMACILRAVYKMKAYGDMRTMMSSNTSVKEPMVLFVVGAALMYSPTAFESLLLSSFGYSTPVPLTYAAGNSMMNVATMQALLGLIQIVGLISFVRGWIMLTHAGNAGQQASFGKAMTHIIGGILAVNVEGTREMLQMSFGVS